jgi:membrane protease YdiL (CAAX protease family)
MSPTESMPSPDDDGTPRVYHAAQWTAGDAGLTFCLALATFLVIPMFLGAGVGPLVVAELAGLAAVPILVIRSRDLPLATIGLVRPRAREVLGAILVGASLWYVAAWLTVPWAELFGGVEKATEGLRTLIDEDLVAIALLSIAPALGEELATRGVLALGLNRRLGTLAAILISAAAFSALHMSLVRALPTFLLGAVLATLTLRTRSVVPAMLAHALNNAVAMLVATYPRGPLPETLEAYPAPTLAVAAAMTAAGIALCTRPAVETRL